jgi:D-xylulose reductase
MMEPLSVAVHAVANVGGLRTGQNVLIMGAGPVGLLAMGVAKGLGAGRIIGVDINQDRLNFAKSYAATDTYVPVSGTKQATPLSISVVVSVSVTNKPDGGHND